VHRTNRRPQIRYQACQHPLSRRITAARLPFPAVACARGRCVFLAAPTNGDEGFLSGELYATPSTMAGLDKKMLPSRAPDSFLSDTLVAFFYHLSLPLSKFIKICDIQSIQFANIFS
jgi:hypothetical protein